jgi:hypothetical protein
MDRIDRPGRVFFSRKRASSPVNPAHPAHPVHFLWTVLAVTLALGAAPARAEQKQDFGNYRVHYSAQNSTELSPEVARRHGIARDPRLALVMLTVQRADGAPVAATVTGEARNLLGQRQPLDMREVREDRSIYYLGLFAVSHLETQAFDFEIRPADAADSYRLRFSQQFFVD